MAKQKYYVVWKGRKQGIFRSWADCEAQVKGYLRRGLNHFQRLQKRRLLSKAKAWPLQ